MLANENHPAGDFLHGLGIKNPKAVFRNLEPAELIEMALRRGEGKLSDTGALMVDTGKFTGRAPDDKYIVKDAETAHKVWWKEFNHPISPEVYHTLKQKLVDSLAHKEIFVRDAFACASSKYRIAVRVLTSFAYHNLFAYNLFIRPSSDELQDFNPDWTIINNPDFLADPSTDGVKSPNFAIINFTDRCIIIGGTAYTGEIKKGIFTVLNYLLPIEHGVLSMHCSANEGHNGQTALFFGLSGTGKTTLSTDPNRKLIGDDEHGWASDHIFNFEGGCYAKVIHLSAKGEPDIFQAVRFGSVLENTRTFEGSRKVNFEDASVTENTRVSYPLSYIGNAKENSTGVPPSHIFFLASDAQGVLPPISRLSVEQAMFHFLSGYTAKVAGTEAGVKEPKAVFSSCFGAPFLPLHPSQYASLLGEKLASAKVHTWLVNTGWVGGPVGVGARIRLTYTRAMISAALEGCLDKVEYEVHPVFGVEMPKACPGVPVFVLNPRDNWEDKNAYDTAANKLAERFIENFQKFNEMADPAILKGAPKVLELVQSDPS